MHGLSGAFSFGKSAVITLDIGREFTVEDKSNSRITIRYDGFDREGFEIPTLFMSISTAHNTIFDNINIKKHSVELTVKHSTTNRTGKDKISLMFNYCENVETFCGEYR